jgi:hypothetical protein
MSERNKVQKGTIHQTNRLPNYDIRVKGDELAVVLHSSQYAEKVCNLFYLTV